MPSVEFTTAATVSLPTESLEIISSFNVPFPEISCSITGFYEMLSPVRIIGAEVTLVIIHAMDNFENPVTVRQ